MSICSNLYTDPPDSLLFPSGICYLQGKDLLPFSDLPFPAFSSGCFPFRLGTCAQGKAFLAQRHYWDSEGAPPTCLCSSVDFQGSGRGCSWQLGGQTVELAWLWPKHGWLGLLLKPLTFLCLCVISGGVRRVLGAQKACFGMWGDRNR